MTPKITKDCNMQKTPPIEGSYIGVLRRYDRNCRLPIRFQTYGENIHSRAIFIDGQVAHTLFVQEKSSIRRAERFGWKDETKRWEQHLLCVKADIRRDDEEKEKARCSLLPQGKDENDIYNSLSDSGWLTKLDVRELLSKNPEATRWMGDSRWTKAKAALSDKSLIERDGFGTKTTYRRKA